MEELGGLPSNKRHGFSVSDILTVPIPPSSLPLTRTGDASAGMGVGMEARWEEDGMGFSCNMIGRIAIHQLSVYTPAFCPALAWSGWGVGSGEGGRRSEEGGRFASTCGLRLRG